MKNTICMFIFIFIIYSLISADTTIPAGNVSGVWNLSGSPYLIEGEITIPDSQLLFIDPGVLVEFQGHYALNVQGKLLAIGNEQDSICFTINDTTGFSNPDTTAGGWHGIRFEETPTTNDTSKIAYSIIEYGKANTGNSGWDYDMAGGAVLLDDFSKVIISNCTIKNNFALTGGAVFSNNSSLVITNTLFKNNSAPGGGAITTTWYNSPTMYNNIIISNKATEGGAIYIGHHSEPLLINNTICNNITTNSQSGAIHLYASNSQINLINNIIWGNSDNQIIGNNSQLDIQFCNIENGLPNYPNYNETNFDFDPFFEDENDHHLSQLSSCINRGIPDTAGLNIPEYDFEGNPRIFQGDNPRIDIGAYEYQGEPILFFPDFVSDINSGLIPFTVQS